MYSMYRILSGCLKRSYSSPQVDDIKGMVPLPSLSMTRKKRESLDVIPSLLILFLQALIKSPTVWLRLTIYFLLHMGGAPLLGSIITNTWFGCASISFLATRHLASKLFAKRKGLLSSDVTVVFIPIVFIGRRLLRSRLHLVRMFEW